MVKLRETNTTVSLPSSANNRKAELVSGIIKALENGSSEFENYGAKFEFQTHATKGLELIKILAPSEKKQQNILLLPKAWLEANNNLSQAMLKAWLNDGQTLDDELFAQITNDVHDRYQWDSYHEDTANYLGTRIQEALTKTYSGATEDPFITYNSMINTWADMLTADKHETARSQAVELAQAPKPIDKTIPPKTKIPEAELAEEPPAPVEFEALKENIRVEAAMIIGPDKVRGTQANLIKKLEESGLDQLDILVEISGSQYLGRVNLERMKALEQDGPPTLILKNTLGFEKTITVENQALKLYVKQENRNDFDKEALTRGPIVLENSLLDHPTIQNTDLLKQALERNALLGQAVKIQVQPMDSLSHDLRNELEKSGWLDSLGQALTVETEIDEVQKGLYGGEVYISTSHAEDPLSLTDLQITISA